MLVEDYPGLGGIYFLYPFALKAKERFATNFLFIILDHYAFTLQ
jgi:hypothetical protein